MKAIKIVALLGLLLLTQPVAAQFGQRVPPQPVPPQPTPLPQYPGQSSYYDYDPSEMVRSWYLRYLDREPDTIGAQSWIEALRQGYRPEMVLAGMLGSQEYYQRAGGTPNGFIQKLMTDITRQYPDRRQYDYWIRRFHAERREDLAYSLISRYPSSWQVDPLYLDDNTRYNYRRPLDRYRPTPYSTEPSPIQPVSGSRP